MDLARYTMDLIEASGGAAELTGYALAEAVVSDRLADALGSDTYTLLAFDPEVAAENEGSCLIAQGTPQLHSLTEVGLDIGRVAAKVASGCSLTVPASLFQRITKPLAFYKCRAPKLLLTSVEWRERVQFRFISTIQSDEKVQETLDIWMDSANLVEDRGTISGTSDSAAVFYEVVSRDAYRKLAPAVDYGRLYERAVEVARSRLPDRAAAHQRDLAEVCGREMSRLLEYYGKLLDDLERRAARVGEDRRDKALEKIEATRAERQVRVDDLLAKYRVTATAALDSVRLHLVPEVRSVIEVQSGSDYYRTEVWFNLALSAVDVPICPVCLGPMRALYPSKAAGNRLVCSESCTSQTSIIAESKPSLRV